MDPALVELLEAGGPDDEVAAVVRLASGGRLPRNVRAVSRFGEILTVRLRRGDIPTTRYAESIISMKGLQPLFSERMPFAQRWSNAKGSAAAREDARRPQVERATGKGVLVGVIDWGFDFVHPDFRRADGATRLLALWDQAADRGPRTPEPYGYGAVYWPQDIDRALVTEDPYESLGYDPSDSDVDGTGTHGTHVAGIAVGNGRCGGPLGVAPEADIAFVHLSNLGGSDVVELGDSATLLEAVDFIAKVAGQRPWVINLSIGRCGEQHDGTTLVEQGLDAAIAAAPGRAIVQSAGNYFDRRLHAAGQLKAGETQPLHWNVGRPGGATRQLELWYPGRDAILVTLEAPSGQQAAAPEPGHRVRVEVSERNMGVVQHRLHEPNNLDNHVLIELAPDALSGTWIVHLTARDVVDGRFHAWIERDGAHPDCQSTFATADSVPYSTTGSICNGTRTIAVGAYNAQSAARTIASFSSCGPTRDGRLKPDLVAPGVAIVAPRSSPAGHPADAPQTTTQTGTSMAAPHVTGTLALMFEAAPEPLRIEDTHNLLLSSVQHASASADAIRYGAGYLDVDSAVRAARTFRPFRPAEEAIEMGNDLTARQRGETSPDTRTRGTTVRLDCSGREIGNVGEEARFSRRSTGGSRESLSTAERVLAEADTIARGAYGFPSHTALLTRTLSAGGLGPFLAQGIPASLLLPSTLFDALATPRFPAARRRLSRLFSVVAYPGLPIRSPLSIGDVLIRRAIRVPGPGYAGLIANSRLVPHPAFPSEDLRFEATRPGFYVHVVEAAPRPHPTAHRFARLVADTRGRLPKNTLVLRPRLVPAAAAEEIDTSSDVDPAIDANRRLGMRLGWASRYDDIVRLLGLDYSPDEADFARAVATWQLDNGFGADGIIGPITWQAMLAALDTSAQGGPDSQGSIDEPAPGPTEDRSVAWGARVSPEFKAKVISMADDLGTSPDYLMASMAFETGETFSPSVPNRAGSGATGLIQFMPSTARSLGTTTAALGQMAPEQQLDYVWKYFAPYRGKLNEIEDVYMAILWPNAVGTPPDTVLFESPTRAYELNRGLDLNADGRVTKQEAAAMVRAKLEKGLRPGYLG